MSKSARYFFFMGITFVSIACRQANQEEKKPKMPATVEVYVVQSGSVDNAITTSGDIIPGEIVELKSETAGRIVKINLSEGKKVTKGTVLIQTDDSELRARLQRLTAELKLAQENQKRKKELLAINGISQAEYELAETETETVLADIALLNAQIRKCSIIAPFDGIIGLRSVSEGSYLSPGTSTVTLIQNDPIKIDFSIPEKYASYAKNGMSIVFTVAGSDKKFTAQIYASQPEITEESRSIKLRALCRNPYGELVPGAFADILVDLGKIENTLMVPASCIVPQMKSQILFVVKNGKAVKTDVETGIRTEDKVQILAGIYPGDSIAITGILALKDKSPVKIKKTVQ